MQILDCHFNLGVLGGMKAEFQEGFSKYSWGGVERGGILIGTRTEAWVRVREYQEVECEHAKGPSWELSESDRVRMRSAIQAAKSAGLEVVGWYHSVSYRSLAVSEADEELWTEFFPDGWEVALVVKRSAKEEAVAAVFWRVEDQIQSSSVVEDVELESSPEAPAEAAAMSHTVETSEMPDVSEMPRIDFAPAVARIRAMFERRAQAAKLTTPSEPARPDQVERSLLAETPLVASGPEQAALPEVRTAHLEPPAPVWLQVQRTNGENLPAGDSAEFQHRQDIGLGMPMQFAPTELVEVTDYAGSIHTVETEKTEAITPTGGQDTPALPLHTDKAETNRFTWRAEHDFLHASRHHREAIASLEYAVTARKGYSMLLGESGMGKTMILECLRERLEIARVEVSFIDDARLDPADFFALLAWDFRLSGRNVSKSAVLISLNELLLDRAQRGMTTALIVDDAHSLSREVLEEIELLGNLETRRGQLLQVVLAGRLELEERLRRTELRGLRQRIVLRPQLGPLRDEETAEYIRMRIERAGLGRRWRIPDGAIHQKTGGLPRSLSAVCDRLLEHAEGEIADMGILEKTVMELRLTDF